MESTATTYTYQSTSPIPSIIALILCVIAIVGMWKTFVKAGVPGWHSLIPILNVYDICKISLKENVGLFTVLSVIFPIVLIYPSIQLAKAFGKGTGFGICLILFGPIARMVLGFGSATYVGNRS